jgi:hypothetical protein
MPFTSSIGSLALAALAPLYAAATPAPAVQPVDLMPIFVPLSLGQTRSVVVPCSVRSYSVAGPLVVRVVSLAPSENSTKLVLEGTARGRTSVLLVCAGNLQQDVSVAVR